jgi:hypothetical protein
MIFSRDFICWGNFDKEIEENQIQVLKSKEEIKSN